jgi:hypothetical protein
MAQNVVLVADTDRADHRVYKVKTHPDSLFLYVAYNFKTEYTNGCGTIGMSLARRDFNIKYLVGRIKTGDPDVKDGNVVILSAIRFDSLDDILKFMSVKPSK